MTATMEDKRGRQIARALYSARPCSICGREPAGRGTVDRHHANGNRLDNSPENIVFLCRKHHLGAHKTLDGMVGGGRRPRVYALMRDRATVASREARRLRASGMSVLDIAQAYGVNPATVYRWFRKYPEPTA